MELYQVRYYLAVCRTKNFTRAAEECHVSQPALSRAIQQLEGELGGELFRRERTLTHMTDLGRAVYPALLECFEANQNAKAIATAFLKQGHAPLRLALSRSIDLEWLSPVLGEISTAFPKIEIKMFRGPPHEILEQLKAGDSEIAVAGSIDEDWDRLNAKKLFEEHYGLLLNRQHALVGRNKVEVLDLAEERLLSRPNCWLARSLESKLKEYGIAKVSKHEVPLAEDLAHLVKANVGIASWLENKRVPDGLVVSHVDGVEMSRWIHLYSVAGRKHSPAAAALINLLRARDWESDEQEVAVVEEAKN
jgi:DNA-binding transcriptional LysR family regulator